MSDHDRDNLNFLLTISPESLNAWIAQADVDDVDYALELLALRKSEIFVRLLDASDDVEDMSEANALLKSFTLKR